MAISIGRREFIAGLGVALANWPIAAIRSRVCRASACFFMEVPRRQAISKLPPSWRGSAMSKDATSLTRFAARKAT